MFSSRPGLWKAWVGGIMIGSALVLCTVNYSSAEGTSVMEKHEKAIGIVGGVGPYAGLDLLRKVFDATKASSDQEHLPTLLHSRSNQIMDRTLFLTGKTPDNPGEVLGDIMIELAGDGATVIGMPCNTAHSPAILDVALAKLKASGFKGQFVHMIREVAAQLKSFNPPIKKVGILCTVGTYGTGIYQTPLAEAGIEAMFPNEEGRNRVQAAIADRTFGIKACSNPVTEKARDLLMAEAEKMVADGAQAVILGCTEIPLAITEKEIFGVPVLDATNVLARALVKTFAPEKLKAE